MFVNKHTHTYIYIYLCVVFYITSLRMLQRSTFTKVGTYAANNVIQIFLFWDLQYNMWCAGSYIYTLTENNWDKF